MHFISKLDLCASLILFITSFISHVVVTYLLVFEMAEKGALMDVDLDKVTIPYSEEESRIYFRQMILGIEYCECWEHHIANPQSGLY